MPSQLRWVLLKWAFAFDIKHIRLVSVICRLTLINKNHTTQRFYAQTFTQRKRFAYRFMKFKWFDKYGRIHAFFEFLWIFFEFDFFLNMVLDFDEWTHKREKKFSIFFSSKPPIVICSVDESRSLFSNFDVQCAWKNQTVFLWIPQMKLRWRQCFDSKNASFLLLFISLK